MSTGRPTEDTFQDAHFEFDPASHPAPAGLDDRDISAYLTNLQNWREHQGKHVLIYGGEIHGFYPARDEALAEGFRRFGRVAFLVKKVDLDEKPRRAVQVIH